MFNIYGQLLNKCCFFFIIISSNNPHTFYCLTRVCFVMTPDDTLWFGYGNALVDLQKAP